MSHYRSDNLQVGFDVPALPGMDEADIQTPALVLDLDALERNIQKMGEYVRARGLRLRAHGKMHKSVDVARLQIEMGGACGICCQKVSEAEVFVRGGIRDVLVSNQVRDLLKIDRLAQLPKLGASVTVCVDDIDNLAEISEAAQRHEIRLGCMVEIDCGAGRCGVKEVGEALRIAKAIDMSSNLTFEGVQAYHGSMQHLPTFSERRATFQAVADQVRETVETLRSEGLECRLVSGGGTGSYSLEGSSGLFNELQCGSYAFMDADYGRILGEDGVWLDEGEWENALFILSQVMSHAKADQAILDAGLKSQSVDSGLPVVFGRNDVFYEGCSDEHGTVADPGGALRIGEKLRLVPGHCDPTVNIHDWYVGVRGGKVEVLWPVSARGKSF